MALGLQLGLAGGGGSSIDADAAAYLALLSAQGVAVTGAQSSAIDAFYVTGKDEGWYSALKRMYLPIWAAAGPNAIDMIGGTSGTYSGTVTHAAGYVQGNGSTGAFDSVTDMVTLGLTTSSASLFYGAYSVTSTTNSDFYAGAYKTSPTSYVGAFRFDSTGGDRYIGFINNASGAGTINSSLGPLGVNVITRTDTGSYGVYKNGDVTVGTTSFAAAVPPLSAMFMARSFNGSSNSNSDGKMYCFGVGLGLSATEAKSLANATQTLWETTTGLSLP